MSFLQLLNIRKTFGQAVAVDNFTLEMPKGEFVALLGPSGCGKTTVLRMIAGFEQPGAGSIILNGKPIADLPANRRNIGMVFQQYALFPNMTVADNIKFGLKIAGEKKSVIQQRVGEMLDLIHMREFEHRYPHQLSGGQQQRVALARALAVQPEVLLLDEPLSALDAKIRVALRQEIRSIQRQIGITTVFVTHDQEEALSISDRIVVMNHSKIEQIGAPHEIYNRPQTQFVATFIGTLNVVEANVTDAGGGRIEIDGQVVSIGEAVPPQTNVSLTIRPEAITLSSNGSGPQANMLNATVDDIYFLGSVVRVRTRLNRQYLNVDLFNNPGMTLPSRGDVVHLAIMPGGAKMLNVENAPASVSFTQSPTGD